MRLVVQRVLGASVEIREELIAEIEKGLLVYLGVGNEDTMANVDYLVNKVLGLRIFEDKTGKMSLNLLQVGGAILLVSQFTLYGDSRKGYRPSFSKAAFPEKAIKLYQNFVDKCIRRKIQIKTGLFREMMKIRSINDGPVTLLLDSSKLF